MAKTFFKAFGLTTLLTAIAMVAIIPSVFAWSGYNTNYNQNTDGSTWQVSERVTGYYNTVGHYEEVLHQSWRGCSSPVSYGNGMYYHWRGWGSLGSYDTGTVNTAGAIYAFSYIQPSNYGFSYVEHASSYSASYFVIGGVNQFKESTVAI
jgi:hypothetical protein